MNSETPAMYHPRMLRKWAGDNVMVGRINVFDSLWTECQSRAARFLLQLPSSDCFDAPEVLHCTLPERNHTKRRPGCG